MKYLAELLSIILTNGFCSPIICTLIPIVTFGETTRVQKSTASLESISWATLLTILSLCVLLYAFSELAKRLSTLKKNRLAANKKRISTPPPRRPERSWVTDEYNSYEVEQYNHTLSIQDELNEINEQMLEKENDEFRLIKRQTIALFFPPISFNLAVIILLVVTIAHQIMQLSS